MAPAPRLQLNKRLPESQGSDFANQIKKKVDELEADLRKTFRVAHYFDVYNEEHMMTREIEERIQALINFFAKHAKLRNRNGLPDDKANNPASRTLAQAGQGEHASSSDSDISNAERADLGSTFGQTTALSIFSQLEKKEIKTELDPRAQMDLEKQRIQQIQAKFKKNFHLVNVLEEDENAKSVGSDTHRGFTKDDNEFENEGKVTLAVKQQNEELQPDASTKAQENDEEDRL